MTFKVFNYFVVGLALVAFLAIVIHAITVFGHDSRVFLENSALSPQMIIGEQ